MKRIATRLILALALAALAGCATAPREVPGPGATAKPVPAVEPARYPAKETAPVAPEPAPDRPIRLTLVGDIMLGGTATEFMLAHGYDYPFGGIATELARGDVVFGNLEGPLTDGGEPFPDKEYLFRTPPARVAPALARAGFDVVSLANNHTLDYGAAGLYDTRDALHDAGIRAVGAGHDLGRARRAALVEVDGHTIGFLAYSNTYPEGFWAEPERPGTAFGHLTHVQADVAALSRRADTVVVSFHWGREGTTELRPYQPLLARGAIDAGADIVAGHHPHVLQGVEHYRDGIIFYSLGNFTFGSYSEIARTSIIAHVTLADDGLQELELVPIDVYNPEVLFRPVPLDVGAATQVAEHLRGLAEPLGTGLWVEDGRARLTLERSAAAARTAATTD